MKYTMYLSEKAVEMLKEKLEVKIVGYQDHMVKIEITLKDNIADLANLFFTAVKYGANRGK